MQLMKSTSMAVGVAAALAVTGCAAPSVERAGESPRVVAAFYPLEWATGAVLGDHGSLSTLATPGMDAHDLELTAQQVASVAEADLVVRLAEFQPAVDEAIDQSGTAAEVLDAGSVVELMPAPEEHDHAAEEEHADDHAEEGDEHEHGDFDPHFWLDPTRMATLVGAIADELSAIDPDNADDYAANAAEAVSELEAINQEFTDGLAQCERTEFITTHTAFGYLADRYGLEEIGIAGIDPNDEPSPARIAEIHDEAELHGVTTIFFETLTSDAVASAIAGDLGLETAVLDPLEGLTDASPGSDYPSVMRANLEALETANGCS